jgi:hypothetical protein
MALVGLWVIDGLEGLLKEYREHRDGSPRCCN